MTRNRCMKGDNGELKSTMPAGFSTMGLLTLLATMMVGCNVGVAPSDRTLDMLNKAIDTIDRQSDSWQSTLQTLERELVADTQSTLAVEVNQLIQRGVAVTGSEARCTVDFVAKRMKQGLQKIVAKITGFGGPAIEPGVCNVVPTMVDLRIAPNRTNVVGYYGYDLDASLKVFLMDRSGGEMDVTRFSTLATNYLMQINVAQNGVPFRLDSARLSVRWRGREMSSIPILQEQVPQQEWVPPDCDGLGLGHTFDKCQVCNGQNKVPGCGCEERRFAIDYPWKLDDPEARVCPISGEQENNSISCEIHLPKVLGQTARNAFVVLDGRHMEYDWGRACRTGLEWRNVVFRCDLATGQWQRDTSYVNAEPSCNKFCSNGGDTSYNDRDYKKSVDEATGGPPAIVNCFNR
jgi:hypothetical protein